MALVASAPIETQPLKRTRICGHQSKNGCLTCKSRRIKCDEGKPSCDRCARSNRICEGYPVRIRFLAESRDVNRPLEARQGPSLPPSTIAHPAAAIFEGFRFSFNQDRLARLGCEIIAYDAACHFGTAGSVLQSLVPRLSRTIPSVNSAAATLGSVYELQLCTAKSRRAKKALVAKQYISALRSVQNDLQKQPHGPIPLLMACLMLAFSEVVLHRPENALTHLLGAYKLLEDLQTHKELAEFGRDPPGQSRRFPADYDILLLFCSLDIQTTSFALPRPPDLPPISAHVAVSIITDVDSARSQLVEAIHRAYHFAAKACKFKYCPQLASRELLIEQGRHIGQLSLWLETLNHKILPQQCLDKSAAPSPVHRHALIMRATCLAILIVLTMIMSPHEVEFDLQAARFQQIVADAAEVMRSRAADRKTLPIRIGPRFTPGPGILYPLVLTALKFRHPRWRRLALELIESSGREGPYYGPRTSKVVQHIIEVEECCMDELPPSFKFNAHHISDLRREPASFSSSFQPSPATCGSIATSAINYGEDLATLIPERYRIHACGMDRISLELPDKDTLTTSFSRCRDIDSMVAAADVFLGLDLQMLYTEYGQAWAPAHNIAWWEKWETTFEFDIGVGSDP